jgi:hypothetical protein
MPTIKDTKHRDLDESWKNLRRKTGQLAKSEDEQIASILVTKRKRTL